MPPPRLLSLVLCLALSGAVAAAAPPEAETFETRLARAEKSGDAAASLRQLDSLVVEASLQDRPDRQVLAAHAHARRQLKSGDVRGVRQELETALAVARGSGMVEEEIKIHETYAEYLLAQGDPVTAAEWLQRAWHLALAQSPPRPDLAGQVLIRLAALHESIGQEHLADQDLAWISLITNQSDAPAPSVELQPLASVTRIPNGEIGRTRLFLANASPAAVTGTLLVDGSQLVVREWRSRGDGEAITLQFPGSARVVPESSAQGRRLTLQPGESRTIMIEVEPGVPPRLAQRTVVVSWQAGTTISTSTAEFSFQRPREFPATSAASACHVRLNPLVSVPVTMEIHHRGSPRRHLQDLWPVTSAPCRVELYEVLTAGATSRQLLAIDADGDGTFESAGDAVVTDRDRTGFPEVAFSRDKPVAALELRLYPLPSTDGSVPEALDLTVSLRDGTGWRVPPDVEHRVKTR